MWKIIESSQYSIYFTDSPTIEVYITDFITLWHVYFSPNEFLSVLKESNSLLTGNKDEVFITKGKEILTTPEKLKHLEITPEEEFLSVFMIKSFGYPFKIKLKLQRSSKELFFQKVTKPLIETADDLKKSESELKNLLIKKDREIERYKRENVQVLQYLKTPAFDEERHKHHYKKYRDTFGTDSIPVHLLTKVIDCPELPRKNGIKDEIICTSDIVVKDEVIKTEPISLAPEIKLEPESQNETITNSSEACIKEEIKPEVENIKPEPLNSIPIISPRKKRKKWNI